MGGAGSGNFYRSRKKATVEQSVTVSVQDVRQPLGKGVAAAGTLTRTPATGVGRKAVGFIVTHNDGPAVTLHYHSFSAGYMWLDVPLATTPTHFGGRRWWVRCPMTVRGVACGRRAGVLCLPPRANSFGCRQCHQLTYRSAQEAHRAERCFKGMGADPDVVRFFSGRLDSELLG